MRVTSISVDAFRNLRQLSISPAPGVNVICGENGQGKTNLLEGIWMFTGARSFRGAKDSELVPLGERVARLSVEFSAGGRDHTASLRFGERRGAAFNGVECQNQQEQAGHFFAAVFSPSHLTLIKGGPAERRRALDAAICQLKPRYLAVLAQYQRLLVQRNALLKDAQLSSMLLDTLEIWDQALAKSGASVAKIRSSCVERLAPLAAEIYAGISNSREELSMQYLSSVSAAAFCGEDELREAMKAARGDDLRTGITSVGPHRDDIEIGINGLSARTYGSQGQQRSAVLAWKLGECDLIEQVSGERPVVLLDDVMSELDESRRDYLLHRMDNRQVFITCCDPRQMIGISGEAVFEIAGGRLAEGGTRPCP